MRTVPLVAPAELACAARPAERWVDSVTWRRLLRECLWFHRGFMSGLTAAAVGHPTLKRDNARLRELMESQGWATIEACERAASYAKQESRAAAPQIAQAFHETCERAAPLHGYETRNKLAVPWEEVPEEHRNLVIAVVEDLLSRGVIQPGTNRGDTK